MQLYNKEARQLEKCRYIILLSKHLHWQVLVHNSTSPDRLDGTDQWTLRCSVLQSWRASLCSERFGVVHKAVTVGSMLSSEHLMVRGGMKLFKYTVGGLSGPVAITPSCLSRTFIQAPSIRKVTLWHEIWASRAYKSDLNHISNYLAMWFGSDLQKSGFICFFGVQTSWKQSQVQSEICLKSDLGW